MIVNTFPDVEELAKETVLYAMEHVESEDAFFEKQSIHSVFYLVYNDLCRKNLILGSYFAIHLKEKYQIDIPIQ